MGGRLAARPGRGREGRLRPPDLELPQLGDARRQRRPTGEGGFQAEPGRYHLYVALICPWASRTLIGRKLKSLDDAISVSVVEPALTDEGWRFGNYPDYPGADRDVVNGATYLHEIYTRADSAVSGRATVPALWDK
jgi:glutathionyl-hydroquinone reductase